MRMYLDRIRRMALKLPADKVLFWIPFFLLSSFSITVADILPQGDLIKINSSQSENLPFALYEPTRRNFWIFYELQPRNGCCQYTYRNILNIKGQLSTRKRIFYGGRVWEQGPLAHFHRLQNKIVAFWTEGVSSGNVKSGIYSGLISASGIVSRKRRIALNGGTVTQDFAYNPTSDIYVNVDESLVTVMKRDGTRLRQYISGENFLAAILVNTKDQMTIISECNDHTKYCFSIQRLDAQGTLIKNSKAEISFPPRDSGRYKLHGVAYNPNSNHLILVYSLWSFAEQNNVYSIKINLNGRKLSRPAKVASSVDKMGRFGFVSVRGQYLLAYAKNGIVYSRLLDRNGLVASSEVAISEKIEGSDSVGYVSIESSTESSPFLVYWNTRTPITQADVYGRLLSIRQ